MRFIPLVYRPDQDCSWEVAPGSVWSLNGLVPTRRGTLASWACDGNTEIAAYTSSTEPQAAGIIRKADGTARFFLFEKQSIHEFTSVSAASDRSKGGGYSASTVTWTWTQFGDTTIAVNLYDNPQSSSSGAFADLAGSPPKAQCVASNLGFVMLANYNDGTAYPDGWACCDIEDPTDWTVTSTNQADRGRLYDTPGPIRALVALRDSIIAYKDDSIYVGDYVGDPATTIWSWRLISDKVGCSSPHGVVTYGDVQYFFHRTGMYMFDGAAVRKISKDVNNKLLSLIGDGNVLPYVQATVDQRDSTVFFFVPFANALTKLANFAAYNIETGRWGLLSGAQNVIFTNVSGATDYPTAVVKCTHTDITAFDSSWSSATGTTVVLVGPNGNSEIAAQYGDYPAAPAYQAYTPTVVTGSIGNGDDNTTVSGISPRLYSYTAGGTTPTCTVYVSKLESDVGGANGTNGTSTGTWVWNTSEYKFDGVASGRYLSAQLNFSGKVELAGMALDASYGGKK